MRAASYNLTIEQGAKFDRTFTWKDSTGTVIDLTGYTARMPIKDLSGNDIITLSTTTDDDGNGITLGGEAGTITLLIKTATTTAMDFTQGKYNLELTDGFGEVYRVMEGPIELSREVD